MSQSIENLIESLKERDPTIQVEYIIVEANTHNVVAIDLTQQCAKSISRFVNVVKKK